ncbi:quinon protein alcohol dehydrogenase-like superfamily [Podospora didyma]|uniref:Quinon protein alcohol dehydrogenase-like superfamily n=1 Tax=Podospora didyma TaxID=330526 RepID=A0AAE0U443_9PEZI|nr:quinon protein alcohol dehydrogenase-like superfamily [Podospora didyma]
MKPFDYLLFLSSVGTIATTVSSSWTGWGGSILNNHWADANTDISSSTIRSLTLNCKIPDSAGQSSPPSFQGSFVYYPTWNGSFVALNYKTCQIKWSINVTQIIADFKPITFLQSIASVTTSRTTPQIDIDNNVLFFGTQIHALLVAVDLTTGSLLAKKQVNPHELATITASPTLYSDMLFVGVSSAEENAAFFTGGVYLCCSFIGNAAAFKFKRLGSSGIFITVWNVTTIPTNLPSTGLGQWSGAGIWGSQPPVDVRRKQVLFATGNTYSIPNSFIPCSESDDPNCFPSYVWQESVFALDIYTGRANWVRRLNKLDAWTLTCGTGSLPRNATLCPQHPGNDSDFGMAPSFVQGSQYTPGRRDVVTLGQKSGVLYGLAADTGAVLWSTLTSPGDVLAGLSWGVAADDRRAYFTGINFPRLPWVLQPGNTTSTNNSLFGAASVTDGSLLWETAAPYSNYSAVMPAVVGDLVITGVTGPPAFQPTGPSALIALKKLTGQIVFEYPLEGPWQGGVAIQDKYITLGTGYKGGTGGAFYVFKVR